MNLKLTCCLGSVALATLSGCLPSGRRVVAPSHLETIGLSALAGSGPIAFAADPQGVCTMQSAAGTDKPQGWERFDTSAVIGTEYRPIERVHQPADRDGGEYVAVRFEAKDGKQLWLRNVPGQPIVKAWSCAVQTSTLAAAKPKLDARQVRLDPYRAWCRGLTPVLGTRHDLFEGAYDVSGHWLFARGVDNAQDPAQLLPVVRLTAKSSHRELVLPNAQFEDCFTAVTSSANANEALIAWWQSDSPDLAQVPDATFQDVTSLLGIPERACYSEGSGNTRHAACVAMPMRAVAGGPGLFQEPSLMIARQRTMRALHFYGDRLVSEREVTPWTIVVKSPKMLGASPVLKDFEESLGSSVVDPSRREQRAMRGYRLVRDSDLGAEIPATHRMMIEVGWSEPALETTPASRTIMLTEKKEVASPEWLKARREQRSLEASARAEAWAGGARKSLIESRTREVAQRAGELPKTTSADHPRPVAWQGKVLTRKGIANIKITLQASDGKTPDLLLTDNVPFEAAVLDPPLGGGNAVAVAPTGADAERALARALVQRIDSYLSRWEGLRGLSSTPVDASSLRSHAASFARFTAAMRPVRLMGDTIDPVDSKGVAVRKFKVPDKNIEACTVFSAMAADESSEVTLVVGIGDPAAPKRLLVLARDARRSPEAGFELCGLPPGEYVIAAWMTVRPEEKPRVLLSVFDSTPGTMSAEATLDSARGAPSEIAVTEALTWRRKESP